MKGTLADRCIVTNRVRPLAAKYGGGTPATLFASMTPPRQPKRVRPYSYRYSNHSGAYEHFEPAVAASRRRWPDGRLGCE